ncbi:hypothetical protein BGW41_000273 [Actinomortierella wolfii]|nr:hypothetical protein BGW41_000273 [Actinomortierella wolfii]
MRLLSAILSLLPAFSLVSLATANTPLGGVRSTEPVDVIFKRDLPPVNPLLSYIATLKENPDGTTTVTCMHGPTECAGNVQELCFKKYNPDYRVWFFFVNALNAFQPWRIGDIEYAREIAVKIGAASNFDAVARCAQSDEGHQLHVESVRHTLSHQISTSCTVFINNEKRCVIDGGVWRECPGGSSVDNFANTIHEVARRGLINIHLLLNRIWG